MLIGVGLGLIVIGLGFHDDEKNVNFYRILLHFTNHRDFPAKLFFKVNSQQGGHGAGCRGQGGRTPYINVGA